MKEPPAPADLRAFRQKKDERVYQCFCGSQHFYLNEDGTIECRSCQRISEALEWVQRQNGT